MTLSLLAIIFFLTFILQILNLTPLLNVRIAEKEVGDMDLIFFPKISEANENDINGDLNFVI